MPTKEETLAKVSEQLEALSACPGLLVVEKDTQEICQSMADMCGILDDLVMARLSAGLGEDDEANDISVPTQHLCALFCFIFSVRSNP